MNPFAQMMSTTFVNPPERPLSPPEPTHAEKLREFEMEERRLQVYESVVAEAMRGLGPFWPTGEWVFPSESPSWDNEQYMSVFCAIRRAYSGIGLTDCEKWEIVHKAVVEEVARMAEHEAEKVVP